MVWVAVVALLAVGAVGCATAAEPLEPLIVGSERFFTLEWAGGERRGRPVVYGSITNEWGFAARRVQLLVESLDGAGRVVGQRVAWLGGELTPGTRASFEVPVAAPAAAYRVRVFAWDWIQSASANMP
jgi:hypothetical protein